MENCEARTRYQRCHTRIRRGGMWWSVKDAAARASGRIPLQHAMWLLFFLSRLALMWLQLGPICIELSRLGPYRRKSTVSAETADSGRNSKKKKKKKVQNALFELNIKPSFNSLHTNTPNSALCLSLSSSLTRLSLSLCSLPLSLLVVRHSASVESVTWLTSVHSFFSSLSCILNSGNDIKLSILVWSLICDLWIFLSFQS